MIKWVLIIAGLAAIAVGIVIAVKKWRRIVDLEDAHLPYPLGEQGITWASRDLWQAIICIIAGIIVLISGLLIEG